MEKWSKKLKIFILVASLVLGAVAFLAAADLDSTGLEE